MRKTFLFIFLLLCLIRPTEAHENISIKTSENTSENISINTSENISINEFNKASGKELRKNSKIYHKNWIDLNKNGKKDIYEDPKQPIENRVKDLLSKMTNDEKSCQLATIYGFGRVLRDSLPTSEWKNKIWKDGIANIDEQLNGVGSGYRRAYSYIYPFSNHTKAINKIQKWFIEETRLGIPVDFTNEGIHGLNHTKATPLPAPIAVGSTWNQELVYKAGEICGKEAKALGYTNVYAPILDVIRDPRWGRTLECYGEDPYLVAKLGTAMAGGIQSQGVASTLKHFAVYSIPKGGRDGWVRTDPHVTPREMHEILLYPFKKVIQDVDPLGVMCSYNDWNGIPIASSPYFLTTLLRDTYGFSGYVVSDSGAVERLNNFHQVTANYLESVQKVLEAGMNVRTNFSKSSDFILPVRELIEKNMISMDVINKRVAEVLSVKFRLGLFDNPYIEDTEIADEIVGADKNMDFVEEIQCQSLVLLKNENNLLPLNKKETKNVLVAGPLACETNFMASRYGPNGLTSTSIYDGICNYLSNDCNVEFAKGCDVIDKNWPDSEIVPVPLDVEEKNMINDAVLKAKKSDVIIAVLGEDDRRTGEGRSRTSLGLPGRQEQLLEALYATGKPVVLVLVNGQPLTINWADRYIPAILESWFPTFNAGMAIAKTLWGDYNPGGKLSVTFPKTTGQIELNFPFKKGSQMNERGKGPHGSGNTHVLGALYPFGYGLSYTTFEYSNLNISQNNKKYSQKNKKYSQKNKEEHSEKANQEYDKNSNIKVSFTITNTGDMKGDEVVQLYIRDLVSSVVTYDSVLRGFKRVTLQPNESKLIEFILTPEDLEILDAEMNWTLEPGDFQILVGASSQDIRLDKTISIK